MRMPRRPTHNYAIIRSMQTVAQALQGASRLAAQRAKVALGWPGILVTDVPFAGRRLDFVCAVDEGAHRERVLRGELPVVQPWALDAHITTVDGFAERSAVSIVGVVARRKSWQSAHRALATAAAFGPGVALLPLERVRESWCWEADVAGFGLLAVDDADADLRVAPAAWSAPEPMWLTRLVEEIVYDCALATGQWAQVESA